MRASFVRSTLVAALVAGACAPRDSVGDTSAVDTVGAAGMSIDTTPATPAVPETSAGVATPAPPAPSRPAATRPATARPRTTPTVPAESAVRYKSPPESLRAAPDYPRVPKRTGGYIWIDSAKKDTTRRP